VGGLAYPDGDDGTDSRDDLGRPVERIRGLCVDIAALASAATDQHEQKKAREKKEAGCARPSLFHFREHGVQLIDFPNVLFSSLIFSSAACGYFEK
ncbi:MAG: hypothetical protein JSU67_02315, partial [Gammaproteobacteria bacterium]